MATEVATGFGKFTLYIQEFQQNVAIVKSELEQLQKLVSQPIVADLRLRGVPRQGQISNAVQNANAQSAQPTGPSAQTITNYSKLATATQNAAAGITKLERAEITEAQSQGRYASALATIATLQQQYATNALALSQLAKLQNQISRQNEQSIAAEATSTARLAASQGEYRDGLIALFGALNDVEKGTLTYNQLALTAINLRKQEAAATNQLVDAETKRARNAGNLPQALANVTEARKNVPTGSPRDKELESQQISIMRELNKGYDALIDRTIKSAQVSGNLGAALGLVNKALLDTTITAERRSELENQAIKIQNDLAAASNRAADAAIRQAQAQRDLQGALAMNRVEQTDAAAAGDTDRVLQLKEREAVLLREIANERQRTVQIDIEAARAAGDYAAATTLVNAELARSDNTQRRTVQLKSQLAGLQREEAERKNAEAIANARLAVSETNYAGAITILQGRLTASIASARNYADVQRMIATVTLQSEAAQQKEGDTIRQILVARNQLTAALRAVQAERAKTGNTAQRNADLELEEARIINQIASADYALAKAKIAHANANKDFAAAEAEANAILSRSNLTLKTREDFEKLRDQAINRGIAAQNQENDSLIRAEIAARNYSRALQLIEAEQNKVAVGTKRWNDLQALAEQTQRRTTGWFDLFRQGLIGIVGPLTAARVAFTAFSAVSHELAAGEELNRTLDLQQRQLEAMFQSVGRGSRTFEEAIAVGRRYGITQREIGEAADDAGRVLRATTVSAEQSFTTLARLQASTPGKTFNDAVRAIAEAQAGQVQTLQRVFNIPQRYTTDLKKAIEAGKDPIIEIGKILDKLGVTENVLAERMNGTSGAFFRQALASERLQVSIGKGTESATIFYRNAMAGVNNSLAQAIENMTNISQTDGPAFFEFLNRASKIQLGGTNATSGNALIDGLKQLAQIETVWGNSVKDTQEKVQTAKDKEARSYEQVRGELVKTSPALKAILDGSQNATAAVQLEKMATDATAISDQFNGLINQFEQGTIDAGQLADQMAKLRDNATAEDTLGIVAAIQKQFPQAEDQLDALEVALNALKQRMGQTTNADELTKLEAEAQAVAEAINGIPREVIVTAEVRAKLTQDLAQVTNEVKNEAQKMSDAMKQSETDYNQAVFEGAKARFQSDQDYAQKRRDITIKLVNDLIDAERQYDQQTRRTLRDQGIADARAVRDVNQQLARQERDYQQQVARSRRDFEQSANRAEQDHLRDIQKMRDDAREKDVENERSYRRKLQDLQRDYDREQARDQEDFEEERKKLLAEGRIKEAQELEKKFQKDQQRKQEDLQRAKSDVADTRQEDVNQATKKLNDKIAESEAKYKEDRERAAADFAQQQADQAAAYAQQLADQKAARDQARQDELADRALAEKDRQEDFKAQQEARRTEAAQQLAKAKEDHGKEQQEIEDDLSSKRHIRDMKQGEILSDYDKFLKDEQQKLDDSRKEIERIEQLKAKNVSDNEATAIAALERSLSEFQRLTTEAQNTTALSGYQAGINFIQEMAKAISAGAAQIGSAVDKTLDQNDRHPTTSAQGIVSGDPLLSRAGINTIVNGGTETSTYSAARPGTTGTHYGVDIAAQEGTTILSPIRGKVISVGENKDQPWAGTSIQIEDDKGRIWYFGHVKAPKVKVGQVVGKGTPLAVIGPEAHVHVQLRPGPKMTPIDPTSTLEAIAAESGSTGAGGNAGGSGSNYGAQSFGLPALVPTTAIDQARQQTPTPSTAAIAALGTADGNTYAAAFLAAVAQRRNANDLSGVRDQINVSPNVSQGTIGLNGASSPTSQQPISIAIDLETSLQLDGQTIAMAVTPHLASAASNGIDVAVQVVGTTQKISTQQAAFRIAK